MIFFKFAIVFLSAITINPAATAITVTYDHAVERASQQHGTSVAAIKQKLNANGDAPKLQQGIQKATQHNLRWGGGSACDLTCKLCTDFATAAGQASIVSLAAWTGAIWACFTGALCPGAIAAAAGTTATDDATFCNSQHQSPGCDWGCSFDIELCTTAVVQPVPTQTQIHG